MKQRIQHLLFIVCVVSALSQTPVYAGAATGGATEPTQWLNWGLLSLQEGSSALTALSTQALALNKTILDPIANQLINAIRQQATQEIFRWIQGGFSGAEPLLISNPEGYLKQIARAQVSAQIGQIASVNSIFGDSAINGLISQFRAQNTQIKNLVRSDLPSTIQNSLCSEESLQRRAENDVAAGLTGESGEVIDVAARKQELYKTFCEKDAARDPKTAKLLVEASKIDRSLSDLNTFLKVTSGDNPYAIASRVILATQKQTDTKVQAKADEIKQTGGFVSKGGDCIEYVKYDDDGNPLPELPDNCLSKSIATPSSLVQELANAASQAGLKRSENVQGTSVIDFSNIFEGLTAVFQGIGTITALSNLAGGIVTDAETGETTTPGSGTDGGGLVDSNGNPIVTDGTGMSEESFQNLFKPMDKQFRLHIDAMQSALSTDDRYLVDMTSYRTSILDVEACFNELVEDHPDAQGEPEVRDGYAFVTSRMGSIDEKRVQIEAEKEALSLSIDYVKDTRSKISAERSAQTIHKIFERYTDRLDSGLMPPINIGTTRENAYRGESQQIQNDESTIKKHKDGCASVRNKKQGSGGGV